MKNPANSFLITLFLLLGLGGIPSFAGGGHNHDHGSSQPSSKPPVRDHLATPSKAVQTPKTPTFFACPMPGDAYHAEKPGYCPSCGMRLEEKTLTVDHLAEMGLHLTAKISNDLGAGKWQALHSECQRLESLHHLLHKTDFSKDEEKTKLITALHDPVDKLKEAIEAKASEDAKPLLASLKKSFEAIARADQ